MIEERIKYMVSIINNEEYAKELFALSKEDALEKLKKDGYDVSESDLDIFHKALVEYIEHLNSGDELDEDTLTKISGGGKKPGWVCMGEALLGSEIVIAGACVAGGLLLGW